MGTTEREKIYALLDEIRTLVEENEKEDETFRFDPVRALIALDFAKTEIAQPALWFPSRNSVMCRSCMPQ